MTRLISFEGNIGSGKSTFIKKLQSYYSNENNDKRKRICFLPEPVNIWNTIIDNNGKTILENFYSNPEKYAFSFQMMAYISRLSLLHDALKESYDIIFTERCIFTDKNIFAKMLYNKGHINKIEYKIYNMWFDQFIDTIPRIELYIHTNRPGSSI